MLLIKILKLMRFASFFKFFSNFPNFLSSYLSLFSKILHPFRSHACKWFIEFLPNLQITFFNVTFIDFFPNFNYYESIYYTENWNLMASVVVLTDYEAKKSIKEVAERALWEVLRIFGFQIFRLRLSGHYLPHQFS